MVLTCQGDSIHRPKTHRGCDGKPHGFFDQVNGLFFAQAAFHKPFHGGLIAGCDNAIRTGFEVIVMELLDGFGLFQQDLCGPQLILQVVAAAFEFGGERAVDHENRLAVQNGGDGILHEREDTINPSCLWTIFAERPGVRSS